MPHDLLYRIEVKDVPAQDVAVVAARVPAAEVGEWLRAAIRELIAAAGQQGTGPPFSVVPDADAEGMPQRRAAVGPQRAAQRDAPAGRRPRGRAASLHRAAHALSRSTAVGPAGGAVSNRSQGQGLALP